MSRSASVIDLTIHAAERVLRKRARAFRLVHKASGKLLRHGASVKSVRADLATMVRLVRAYLTGSYREVPWRTLVLVGAALVYFVNPFDVIPDFLIGIGFVDDVAVITTLVGSIARDLTRFRTWERGPVKNTARNAFRTVRNRIKAV